MQALTLYDICAIIDLNMESTQTPQIGIIDDNPDIHMLAKLRLELEGYIVPDQATASCLETAKQLVQELKLGKLTLHAVLLDANLTPGETSGRDGRYVANSLYALQDRPIVVGFSAHPMKQYDIPVDFDARKNMPDAIQFLNKQLN